MTPFRWLMLLVLLTTLAVAIGAGARAAIEAMRLSRDTGIARIGDDSDDLRLWEAFSRALMPEFTHVVELDFARRLDEAIGFSSLAAPIVRELPNAPGDLGTEIRIAFRAPDVELRMVARRQSDTARSAVFILHGMGSSADKVQGFDNMDYMRRVGATLFAGGHDVFALDLPSNPAVAQAINYRLLAFATTLEGLWTRGLCAAIEKLAPSGKYQRVVVYGVSEGGRYALSAGLFCAPFTIAVSHGGAFDRRVDIWQAAQKQRIMHPHIFDQLLPLEASTCLHDFIANAGSPVIAIGEPEDVEAFLKRRQSGGQTDELNTRGFGVVSAVNARSILDVGIVQAIVSGDYGLLEGTAFEIR